MLRACGLLLLAFAMLTSACTLVAPRATQSAPVATDGELPRTPPALDVPPGADVLFFVTGLDIDYGAGDRVQYIKDFEPPSGVVDLDVRCVDIDGASLSVKVFASPGNRQAGLTLSCTLEKGHQHGTYDLGPPYEGSRWTAEINARRRTRFQVLITQPGPKPAPTPKS
ncbi:MAG: hypothetical protein ACRDYX_09725 [Egibacteraceae bacterium]